MDKIKSGKILAILTMLVVFIMIMPYTKSYANAVNFTDVGNKYKEAVDYLVAEEITKGVNAKEFGTNQTIKRGDAAVFIARALKLDIEGASDQGFVDLSNRIEREVNAIVSKEIASGKTKTTFNPDANITRQEMAKMLANAYELKATSIAGFIDVSTSWMPYVSALKDHGITFGKSEELFFPTAYLTRGEFALFIYRAERSNGNTTPELPETPQVPEEEILPVNPEVAQRIVDIKQRWQQLKPAHSGEEMKVKASMKAPYSLGEVEAQAIIDGLNMTNFTRYLSYLPDNIRINESFNKEAQAASVVNAANQMMTHYPSIPAGMTESFFNLGAQGAVSSNIGIGYGSIASSIKIGYMPDFSNSNRVSIGHRRWVLSPKLQEVGLGYANDITGRGHTAMKVIAPNMWGNPTTHYDYIAWPSEKAFPTDFFKGYHPWSVSLNEKVYDASRTSELIVKLTRANNGETWIFSENNHADGFFNVDLQNYGYTPYTIIFEPDRLEEILPKERYEVEVQNIYKLTGEKVTLTFETTFFDL